VSADDHGSASTYKNWKCRCAACTEAWRVACERSMVDRAERLAADPSLAAHGRASTYTNWRCRCAECKAAWSVYLRQRRSRAATSPT